MIGVFAPLTLLGILMYKGVEPSALVSGFIGMLLSSYPMIFQYYFGSSSGSKNKQELIDKMATAPVIGISAEDEAIFRKKFASYGLTITYEEWLAERRQTHSNSGATISFIEWLKIQS